MPLDKDEQNTGSDEKNSSRKFVFDIMGVLLEPAHLIKNAFHKYTKSKGLNMTYEEVKRLYKLASRGDAWALNHTFSIEEQRSFLSQYVYKKPKNFRAFESLLARGKRLYLLTNMPCFWGIHIYDAFFSSLPISGLYISGCCTLKKPEQLFFEHVNRALRQQAEETDETKIEIHLFDDKDENLASAKAIGWHAHKISKDGDVEEELREF